MARQYSITEAPREADRLRDGRISFGDALRQFAAAHPLHTLCVDQGVFDGVRDRSAPRKASL